VPLLSWGSAWHTALYQSVGAPGLASGWDFSLDNIQKCIVRRHGICTPNLEEKRSADKSKHFLCHTVKYTVSKSKRWLISSKTEKH
jgi:hypothetical protein